MSQDKAAIDINNLTEEQKSALRAYKKIKEQIVNNLNSRRSWYSTEEYARYAQCRGSSGTGLYISEQRKALFRAKDICKEIGGFMDPDNALKMIEEKNISIEE